MARIILEDNEIVKQRIADRPWRLITIAAWVPTLALLLAHGLVSHLVSPALGIIPSTFSLIIGIICVMGWIKPRGKPILYLDIFTIIMIVAFLIAGLICLSYDRADWQGGNYYTHLSGSALLVQRTILGMFGLFGLMVDLIVHSYMVLRLVDWDAIKQACCCSRRRKQTRCVDCACALPSADIGQGYRRMGTEDEGKIPRVRVSEDAETSFRDSEDAGRVSFAEENVSERARLL